MYDHITAHLLFYFSVGYPIMITFLQHLTVVSLLTAVFQGKSPAEDQMEKLKGFI